MKNTAETNVAVKSFFFMEVPQTGPDNAVCNQYHWVRSFFFRAFTIVLHLLLQIKVFSPSLFLMETCE